MTYPTTLSNCLSVSIVLYQSPLEPLRSTLECLIGAAQYAVADKQLTRVQLTLVDNSGDPVYAGQVRDLLSGLVFDDFFAIKYVIADRNMGFGGGHNLVLPAIDGEFHLILNPDAELAEGALLAGLLVLQQDPGIVLVSPAVVGSSNEPEYLCKAYPSVLILSLRAFAPAWLQNMFRARLEHYELRATCSTGSQANVPLASGCCMLLRSAALRAVSGFDERYFLYFEDFDLSLRLRQSGRLVFEPAMQIQHHGGYAATKGTGHIGMFVKSGVRFFNDHGWKWI
jgi:GT2 family glycosyltransferase